MDKNKSMKELLKEAMSQIEQARDVYADVAEHSDDAKAFREAGILSLCLGDERTAVGWFKRAVELEDTGAHRYLLGIGYEAMGEAEEAERQKILALELGVDTETIAFLQGLEKAVKQE